MGEKIEGLTLPARRFDMEECEVCTTGKWIQDDGSVVCPVCERDKEIKRLEDENTEARKVIEFYGDEENWYVKFNKKTGDCDPGKADDCGAKAREWLEKYGR